MSEPANRPKRTPFSKTRRMTFQDRPGYKRRVFNDVDDRIQRAIEAGYVPVQDPKLRLESDKRTNADTQMGSVVRRSVGNGVSGMLMEIPEDIYNADQAAKVRETEEMELDLKRDAKRKGLKGTLSIGRKDKDDESDS